MTRGWMWLLASLLLALGSATHSVYAQTPLPCDETQARQALDTLLRQGTLTIHATEEQVNGCLQKHMSRIRDQTGLRSVAVDFREGYVRLKVSRGWPTFTVDLEPQITDGQLYVRLRGVWMGFFPLPAGMFQKYVDRINAQLQRAYAHEPLARVTVQSLTIHDDALTVTLTLRK